jgi:hypothetical protein
MMPITAAFGRREAPNGLVSAKGSFECTYIDFLFPLLRCERQPRSRTFSAGAGAGARRDSGPHRLLDSTPNGPRFQAALA